MSESLKVENKELKESNTLEINFIGEINEDANFSVYIDRPFDTYIFNFEKVTLINSCGLREWVKFIEAIPETKKLIYDRCPQHVIEQVNLISGFIRRGSEVREVYAPYFCQGCEKEFTKVLDPKDIKNDEAPEFSCEECGEELMFDAVEETYFRFLHIEDDVA